MTSALVGVDRAALPLAEQDAYDAGYLRGAVWGLDRGRRQRDLELADEDARDDLMARRIVALILQHDHGHKLADMVTTTAPYSERGIPRRAVA